MPTSEALAAVAAAIDVAANPFGNRTRRSPLPNGISCATQKATAMNKVRVIAGKNSEGFMRPEGNEWTIRYAHISAYSRIGLYGYWSKAAQSQSKDLSAFVDARGHP